MVDTKPTRKIAIGGLVVLAVVGVLVAKRFVQGAPSAGVGTDAAMTAKVADTAGNAPTAYLFFNGKDQDSGCQALYGLFDQEAKALPPEVKIVRVDVNSGDDTLIDRYQVRVLPTVLLVDAKGEVKERIAGEGTEVEARLRTVLARAREILKI